MQMELHFTKNIMKPEYKGKRDMLQDMIIDIDNEDETGALYNVRIIIDGPDPLQVLEGTGDDAGKYVFKMDFGKSRRNVEQQFFTCLGILISLRCKDKGEGYAIKHIIDNIYKNTRCL